MKMAKGDADETTTIFSRAYHRHPQKGGSRRAVGRLLVAEPCRVGGKVTAVFVDDTLNSQGEQHHECTARN